MEYKRVNFTIPKDLWRKFRKYCIEKGYSFSGRICVLISKDLEGDVSENGKQSKTTVK
jgi:hypothetical protein